MEKQQPEEFELKEIVKSPGIEEPGAIQTVTAGSTLGLGRDANSLVSDGSHTKETKKEGPKEEPEAEKKSMLRESEYKEKRATGASESSADDRIPKGRYRGGYRPPLPPVEIPQELIPADALDVTLDKSRKLWKVVLHPGDLERPANLRYGKMVFIYYKSWFLNDPEKTVFDQVPFVGDTNNAPLSFILGDKQAVLRMFHDGVNTMRYIGEKALFISHFDFAYGRFSSSRFHSANIPNESFICSEVVLLEAVNVQMEDNVEEDIKITTIKALEQEPDRPLTDQTVLFVNLEGFTDEENPRKFFGPVTLPFVPYSMRWAFAGREKYSESIPIGLQHALKNFRGGEKGWVELKGKFAFSIDVDIEDADGNKIEIEKEAPVKFLVDVEEEEEVITIDESFHF